MSARLTRSKFTSDQKRKQLHCAIISPNHTEKYEAMSLEEKRTKYACGNKYVTINDIPTWPVYAKQQNIVGCKCFTMYAF
jgi:hypothetical protein